VGVGVGLANIFQLPLATCVSIRYAPASADTKATSGNTTFNTAVQRDGRFF